MWLSNEHPRVRKSCNRVVTRGIIFVCVTVGLAYQTFYICDEYFKYPTTTYFSMANWPPLTLAPKMVICVPFHHHEGEVVSDLFSRLNDSSWVESAELKKSPTDYFVFSDKRIIIRRYEKEIETVSNGTLNNISKIVHLDKFVLLRRYCVVLQPSESLFNSSPPAYSPADLYSLNNERSSRVYEFDLRTNIHKFSSEGHELSLYLLPYQVGVEAISKMQSSKMGTNKGICYFMMSYSAKVTKLSPPPYNTECMDYARVGFTSRGHCFSNCLDRVTMKYGIIMESSVLSRKKFEKSSLTLRSPNDLIGNSSSTIPDLSYFLSVCNYTCRRPDCQTESLVLEFLNTARYSTKEEVKEQHLKVLPPNDQIITVTSVPKLTFVDLLMYASSCIGIWYGVGPIDLINIRIPNFGQFSFARRRNVGKSVYKAIIILIATLGFSWQAIEILIEYLKYPTATLVSIQESTTGIISPRVVFAVPFDPGWAGEKVQDVFNRLYRNESVVFAKIRMSETDQLTMDKSANPTLDPSRIVEIRSFIKSPFYYISVGPKEPIHYSTDDLYTTPEKLFEARVITDIRASEVNVNRTFGRPSIFMSSYDSDFEGLTLAPIPVNGRHDHLCLDYMTYSAKVSKLAPPPYDTGCRDYRKSGLSSRENCVSECLTNFTKQHGMIVESNVITVAKYAKSPLMLMPWYFRDLISLQRDRKEISEELLRNEYHLFNKLFKIHYGHTNSVSNFSQKFLGKLIEILPSYKIHWHRCNVTCRRPDCHTELVTPQILTEATIETTPGFQVGIHPPSHSPITVTSSPQFTLLNLVIYLIGCLTFWYGICPLKIPSQIDEMVDKRLKSVDGSSRLSNYTNRPRGQRNSMSFFKVLFRLSTYLSVLGGFSYQTFFLCQDYFAYLTSTLVSMDTALPITVSPKIVVTRRLDEMFGGRVEFSGLQIRDVFNRIDDNTTVTNCQVRVGTETMLSLPPNEIDMELYFRTGTFSIALRTKKVSAFSPSQLYKYNKPQYSVTIRTNQMDVTQKFAVSLAPYSSDLEGVSPNVPIYLQYCYRGKNKENRCTYTLSYSIKIAQLEKAPYDTNCRNYEEFGLSSKEKCLSECLTTFTKKHGMILESNIISKRKYANSQFILMPHFMRTMISNRTRVTREFIRRRKTHDLSNYYDKIVDIFPSYENHWNSCNRSCSQPDCQTETLIPHRESRSSSSPEPGHLRVNVYPPRDAAIVVKSEPKQTLLDFIVLVACCLSFWFGSCVLQVADLAEIITRSLKSLFTMGEMETGDRLPHGEHQLTSRRRRGIRRVAIASTVPTRCRNQGSYQQPLFVRRYERMNEISRMRW